MAQQPKSQLLFPGIPHDHWANHVRNVVEKIVEFSSGEAVDNVLSVQMVHVFDAPTPDKRQKLLAEWSKTLDLDPQFIWPNEDCEWASNPSKKWADAVSPPDWVVVTWKKKNGVFVHQGLQKKKAAALIMRLGVWERTAKKAIDAWWACTSKKERFVDLIFREIITHESTKRLQDKWQDKARRIVEDEARCTTSGIGDSVGEIILKTIKERSSSENDTVVVNERDLFVQVFVQCMRNLYDKHHRMFMPEIYGKYADMMCTLIVNETKAVMVDKIAPIFPESIKRDGTLRTFSDELYEMITQHIMLDMMQIRSRELADTTGSLISKMIADKIVELGVSHRIRVVMHKRGGEVCREFMEALQGKMGGMPIQKLQFQCT